VDAREASVYVEDLDIPQNKISDPAWRIIDRAIEESRRHGHRPLTRDGSPMAAASVST
jgi:hypothetical protein